MIKIPAIDIIDGRVVRLTQGVFDKQKTYAPDMIDLAKSYEDAGANYLHVIDLDAARGKTNNRKAIYEIIKKTNLTVQLGGGIRSEIVLKECLTAGIKACIIGSLAVSDKKKVISWIKDYGAEKIIIGADVRNGYIATEGWLETSKEHIADFIKDYSLAGARRFLCTDISLDGTLLGTSNKLYSSLVAEYPKLEFIASGGVASMNDLYKLEQIGMYGVVIGKALLERKITLKELYS